MKNVVDMDDWLRSQGIKAVDFELMDLLKNIDREMEIMLDCLKAILQSTRADLEAATLELQRRDQKIEQLTEYIESQFETVVGLEKQLNALKRQVGII